MVAVPADGEKEFTLRIPSGGIKVEQGMVISKGDRLLGKVMEVQVLEEGEENVMKVVLDVPPDNLREEDELTFTTEEQPEEASQREDRGRRRVRLTGENKRLRKSVDQLREELVEAREAAAKARDEEKAAAEEEVEQLEQQLEKLEEEKKAKEEQEAREAREAKEKAEEEREKQLKKICESFNEFIALRLSRMVVDVGYSKEETPLRETINYMYNILLKGHDVQKFLEELEYNYEASKYGHHKEGDKKWVDWKAFYKEEGVETDVLKKGEGWDDFKELNKEMFSNKNPKPPKNSIIKYLMRKLMKGTTTLISGKNVILTCAGPTGEGGDK